ncbi:hypothetical protein KY362_03615 [Candidatus Woesearchaeota archaeon]|nr:hypothetical protein [Candidatus Woesearchaeota archaeon]
MVILAAFLSVFDSVAAVDLLIESEFEDAGDFALTDLYFIGEDNPFYLADRMFAMESPMPLDAVDMVVFLDRSGKEFLYTPAITSELKLVRFRSAEKLAQVGSFRVIHEGAVHHEQEISFCDSDGVCEPCHDFPCSSAESFASCEDCASGSSDHYCDLERDGVCDPDCNNRDGDCPACTACLFIDMAGLPCEDIGGTECDNIAEHVECRGELVVLDDYVDCCIGTCFSLGEFVETVAEMQAYPEHTVTPSGIYASALASAGGPEMFCVEEMGGDVCAEYERCDGPSEDLYYNMPCCLGFCELIEVPFESCVGEFDEPAWTEEDAEWEEALISEPLLEDGFTAAEIVAFESYDGSSEERDAAQMAAEEEWLRGPEQPPQDIAERIEQFIPEEVRGYSPAIIIGGVTLLLVLLVLLIALFRRSAKGKMEQETGAASQQSMPQPQTGTAPPDAAIDLQPYIDSMITKGYSYAQVRATLMKRGYSQSLVDAEIRKNYDARKSRPAPYGAKR